tara:strand:+ start:242 stop:568 length:327 start_codon:yes stop_codon:yes gene_type:complete
MVKTKKSKVKVDPIDPELLAQVLEVVSQVVEPEPEPEHECACYSPEECSGDCPAIEESGGPNFIYEPEPEPEPEPKPLRPCERVLGPEEIERRRLDTEKRRANKLKSR